MEIGILTHYDVNNQGAQLQMYALYNQLKLLGHDPVILTYNKNFDFKYTEKLKNQISIRSFSYIFKNYLLKKGFRLTSFNTKKYLKNKKFRKNYFNFKQYTTTEIDCAIVGSDEVYSIPCGVNIMMFGHGLSTESIISYAPSFGQTDFKLIKTYNYEALISSGLKKCKVLSSRDLHTKNLIKDLTGKDTVIVCDPVILYDFKNTYTKIKRISNKYILVYSCDRFMIDKNEIKAIKEYANANGLITVSAGTYHKWCDKNVSCNCLEWIEYFRNSECVITDTFHGTVVSMISNKPMAIFVRGVNTNKLTDLLDKTGLSDRRIKKFDVDCITNIFKHQIDFLEVNEKLDEMRKFSNNYLKDALLSCEKK